jgi:hypothetical protein
MVSRTTLILWLLLAMSVLLILEQPSGSLMEMHPRLADFIDLNGIFRQSINLYEFGAPTRKPLWIYSQFAWIKDLLLFKTRTLPSKTSKHSRSKAKKSPASKRKSGQLPQVSINKVLLRV